jgi:hypothetical protein
MVPKLWPAACAGVFDWRFFLHSSHSPVGPSVPTQAHLRWSVLLGTGVKDGPGFAAGVRDW